jgi:hypothetical protein
MTIVCNGYSEVQTFKETVINIQQAIGGLWMSSLWRGSPPDSLMPTGLKELPMLYARNKRPQDWLQIKVLEMKEWKGSTHKMVGLEVLVTYKTMAAWFLSPPEDKKCLLQCPCRLNWGLNTGL